MFRLFSKKENKNNLYPDIPRIEDNYEEYPAKIFVIEEAISREFILRIIYDDSEKRSGYINPLLGPNEDNNFRVEIPTDKLIELLTTQITHRRNNSFSVPGYDNFILGAIDVVTYPFYYAIVNSINLDNSNLSEKLWRINNNLINEYIPKQVTRFGTLTIFHFNEEPLDDAPAHNVFLFSDINPNILVERYNQIIDSQLIANYVSHKYPIMDDRYLLASRSPRDGDPFDLSAITSAIQNKT